MDGTKPTVKSKKYESGIEIKNHSGSSYIYTAKGLGYGRTGGYYPTTVDMGTVVRAIMVDEGGNVADEKQATYYVGLNGDLEYFNMPVISINAEDSDLFG